MPETTPLIKAALNLRGGAGFDVYPHKEKNKDTRCPADICSVRTEAERRQENLVTANNKL